MYFGLLIRDGEGGKSRMSSDRSLISYTCGIKFVFFSVVLVCAGSWGFAGYFMDGGILVLRMRLDVKALLN